MISESIIWKICQFQLFFSFFKSLVGKDVVVELKNDLRLVVNVLMIMFNDYFLHWDAISAFAVLCILWISI